MIDIVIPTLYKSNIDYFNYSLNEAIKSNSVGNIYIINNTGIPSPYTIIKDKKITIIDNKTNNFVNPSWNQGMSLCKNKYFCILNDDVLCSYNIYEISMDMLDQDDKIGIITCSTVKNLSKELYLKKTNDMLYNKLSIKNNTDILSETTGFSGWFMIGRKDQWIDIPSDLKIFYGDYIIYLTSKKLGFKNIQINSNIISHYQSSTLNKSRHIITDIANQDHFLWRQKYKTIYESP